MTWTAPAFMDELKTRLEDWEALSGVKVYTAPIPPDQMGSRDFIVFLRAPGTGEWASLGNQSRKESYTLEGTITTIAQGSGEQKAKEARDKAADVISAMESCLRDIIQNHRGAVSEAIGASQLFTLSLSKADLDAQGGGDGKRWCAVDFDIAVSAHT